MQICTSLLPRPGRCQGRDVAVVIDVLRATSVMATALDAGAARIVTCREVDEARELANQYSPRPLLCGERGCKPIEGFDLGNSPAEYVDARVSGRTLILTTTNGTRAVEASMDAERIITASFLNFAAVVDSLATADSVELVCAGTEGAITAEDALLAGAIVAACETRYDAVSDDDESSLARGLWNDRSPTARDDDHPAEIDPDALARALADSRGGRNLIRVGYEADLARCAAANIVSTVPRLVSRSPATFEL